MIASRNQFSQTPLYFAVRCRNREVVDVLLKYGALINATNGYGKLPIVGAVEESDLVTVVPKRSMSFFTRSSIVNVMFVVNVIFVSSSSPCFVPNKS